MTPDIDENAAAADPIYAFKLSLVGSMAEFVLRPDAMEWKLGRRTGRVRYDQIKAMRLSYRPVTMQSHRFITEIWSPRNPKVQIVSVSWRSIMEQERLDKPYLDFVTELHRRVAGAGGVTQFTTGLPIVTYWVGMVVFAAVMLGTGGLVLRAASFDQWAPFVVVALFFLVFAYQLSAYFYRNRPRRYRPDALPRDVLPKV